MFSSRCISFLSGRRARSIWRPPVLALLIVFLPFARPLHAAVLHFANGDRVTGTVERRVDGKIYFHADVLGELVIPEQDASVELDAADTATNPTTQTAATQPVGPVPAHVPRWKGKIEFGFQSQSSSPSSINGSLRGDMELKKKANDYLASVRYLYGEADHVTTSNRQDASFRWRHDLTPRIFTQSKTSYTRDRVTGIRTNLEQNGSLGYQFQINERQKASTGAGVTLQYRDTLGFETGVNFLGQVFQDYSYKINDRISISQSFNALYSPEPAVRLITTRVNLANLDDSAANYRYSFDSTLQGKMTEKVSLNLSYEYDYDNAILNREERGTQRVTSSIGYSF